MHADGTAGRRLVRAALRRRPAGRRAACWRLESDQVARYRRAVADDVQGPGSQAEIDRLEAAGFEHPAARQLIRVPGGLSGGRRPRAGPAASTSRCTRAATWEPADWLHDRRALDVVRDAWRELRALNTWLADNVGATTKEIRRR